MDVKLFDSELKVMGVLWREGDAPARHIAQVLAEEVGWNVNTTYTLIKNHHISSSTLDKLRKNKPLNTTTINDFCRILHCNVEHIMAYVPSDQDQAL